MRGHSLQTAHIRRLAELASAQEAERFRFGARASGVAFFDWSVGEDTIRWDGALDLLPYASDPGRVNSGRAFVSWLSPDARQELTDIIATRSSRQSGFELDLDASSAMGPMWLTFVGARIPSSTGETERLVGVMRLSTERQREVQRLSYLATRDELTGQLNRNSLRAELAQAIERAKRESRHCAFLVASIDRLAMINDGYGLDAGDEVIVAIGERLANVLRDIDVIGRTAGNKFGVILGNCNEREIGLVAERLRGAVRDSAIDTRSGPVFATSSVGAVWLPQNASSSQEAMLRAEEALDRARATGRDGFAVYQKSAQREMARLRLMGVADEIVAALSDDRLKLAYQPIIDAKTGAVSHYEGLLRMVRPDGSLTGAGQFIPAAEQMGLIRLVDRRALEMTFADLRAQPGVHLGVNVSGTTAVDGAWLRSFVDFVRANRDVAARLIVELTETAALHHFEESAQFLSQLRELGCKIAIDDFGAGYTSFRNLRTLKIDMVKIDGSYVTNLCATPENQIFVRTLVDLAKSFHLKTVAEWVGSEEDADLLRSYGVDYLQGYIYGEPVLRPDWKG